MARRASGRTDAMASRFGLEIRAADAGDVEGLAGLLVSHSAAGDARTLGSRLQNMRAGDGLVLVAMEWGPPSGVIALSWNWSLNADLRTAHITTLVVAPEARRRGIARLLLKAASQAARAAHCGELVIMARGDAPHINDFCLATGFTESGNVFSRSLRKGSSDSAAARKRTG